MTNKVLHAFPSPSAFTPDGDTLESGYNGMTMRDYFAAKAMAALLSRSGPYGEDQKPICREDVFTVDELAEYAYAQADAMLTIRALPDNAVLSGGEAVRSKT